MLFQTAFVILFSRNGVMALRGGKRENAGRKSVIEDNKKVGYKIYLSSRQKQDVEEFAEGSSFSEKCVSLIEQQLNFIQKKNACTVKIIDLFAGLGGIRIGFTQGFEKLGYNVECVFSSEIKSYAIAAYKNYFGDGEIHGDITKIKSDEIPNFDFLLAGFPCQPFSSAGKQLGFSDTRGTMFFEIERILKDKKPYGFLLENVEGLVTHDKGNTLRIIIQHLKALGYAVSFKLIDSQYFGLAQSRKRVYIVGMRNQPISLEDFPVSTATLADVMEHNLPTVDSHFTRCLLKHYSVDAIQGKAIKDKRGGKDNIHSWDIELKGETSQEQRDLLRLLLRQRRKKQWADEIGIKWMDGMPLTVEQITTFYDNPKLKEMLDDLVKKGYLVFEHPREQIDGVRVPDFTKPKGYNIVTGKLSFEFSRILSPDDLVPTLVAMDADKMGLVDGNGIRRLTIRECQRLCGYDDDYDLSIVKEKEAYDLLGNTVCVPVISAIAGRMAKKYK